MRIFNDVNSRNYKWREIQVAFSSLLLFNLRIKVNESRSKQCGETLFQQAKSTEKKLLGKDKY